MPSPSCEKGRVSRLKGFEDEFVLFIQGIPPHCRWQELKDMVRQTALHIRQAVVYDDQHGFPTGLGQIIVKNEEEAWRTYQRLSTNGWDGQSLVVTLARTCSPTEPVAGPTKSPPCVVPPPYVPGYSTPPSAPRKLAVPASPMSPEPVISPSPTYQGSDYTPVMSPMGMIHHHPFVPIFADPFAHGIPPSPVLHSGAFDPLVFAPLHYPLSPMQPLHEAQINSIRMNGCQRKQGAYGFHRPSPSVGSVYPNVPSRPGVRRTVHVQNLNIETTSKELRAFFSDAGTIENCDIPEDFKTGKPRGYAKVTFRTAEEAKRAAALFNNTILMGAKLRVRIDRSNFSISEGTGPGLHWRRGSHIPDGNVYGIQLQEAAHISSQFQYPKDYTDFVPAAPAAADASTDAFDVGKDAEKDDPVYKEETPKTPVTPQCQPLVINGSVDCAKRVATV